MIPVFLAGIFSVENYRFFVTCTKSNSSKKEKNVNTYFCRKNSTGREFFTH